MELLDEAVVREDGDEEVEDAHPRAVEGNTPALRAFEEPRAPRRLGGKGRRAYHFFSSETAEWLLCSAAAGVCTS